MAWLAIKTPPAVIPAVQCPSTIISRSLSVHVYRSVDPLACGSRGRNACVQASTAITSLPITIIATYALDVMGYSQVKLVTSSQQH